MKQHNIPLSPKLTRRLVVIRYALPLLNILILLISGMAHTVRAVQSGTVLWVSIFQLCFNTIKAARAYFIGTTVNTGESSFYGFLLAGAVVALLLFLAAAVFAVFAAWQFYYVLKGTEPETMRAAKIRFKTLFPNRVCLLLSELLCLLPALFCEYFSFIGKQYLGISGSNTFYVTCNVTLIVLILVCVVISILSVLTAKKENNVALDMFSLSEEQEINEHTQEKI